MKNSGTVCWQAPANIALIKYWGKKDTSLGPQLPATPSLSMTLAKCLTKTELSWGPKKVPINETHKNWEVDYLFEGNTQQKFLDKILKYFSQTPELEFLQDYALKITSTNTFPHSTGIASSASSMAALGLAIASMEEHILGVQKNTLEFFQRASHLARLGSGSACRSVYGHFSTWGESVDLSNTHDGHATPYLDYHSEFSELQDAVLVISSKEKKLSSTAGHNKMNEHFYREARYHEARVHFKKLLEILKVGDWQEFQQIVQKEAMSLHGMLLTSNPPTLLMEANTLCALRVIEDFEFTSKIPLAYTLDAGPNIHLLYPKKERAKVIHFIQNELVHFCENKLWIDDEMGRGPQRIDLPMELE